MNTTELMKEALELYNALHDNTIKYPRDYSLRNRLISRRLHLIERELDFPLSIQIVKEYFSNSTITTKI